MSSPWTPAERQSIASKLNQLLPPETVHTRSGPGGGVQNYLRIQQARALANDVFGAGNWHTEVRWQEVDEERSEHGNFEVAVSCAVRVTLRDGTFREDVGSCTTSGPERPETMRRARSIAAADATKRALRLFGPALGNCLYDASYTRWLAANPSL